MVKEVRFVAALVGALALGACSDSPTSVPRSLSATGPEFVTLTAAQALVVPGPSSSGSPASYPLYAGGGGGGTGQLVGHVLVSSALISGNHYNITVTYSLTVGCLNETHLQIALTTDGVPQKNGNPIPGQFDSSHNLACTTTDSYTINFDMGSGTDNAVVIAAHAVVSGVGAPAQAAADYVSGSTLPAKLLQRRAGNVSGFTDVSLLNQNLVLAWQPTNNTQPSYWNTVISADPSGNGLALLNAGANWVWESFRVIDPQEGDVIEAEADVNITLPTTGTFRITCDNGYRVDFNNGLTTTTITNGGDGATSGTVTQLSTAFASDVGLATNTNLKDANVDAQGWQTVESYPISLVAGKNAFFIYGVNEFQSPIDSHRAFAGFGATLIGADPAGPDPVATVDKNPAGCLFGLHADAVASGEETAWGAPNGFTGATLGADFTGGNFTGKNWATYFVYQVRP